jgi:hypothetical protein
MTVHELPIFGDSGPLITVIVFLRDLPKPQGVVRKVIVQLDQPRKHCAAGIEHRYAFETGRCRIGYRSKSKSSYLPGFHPVASSSALILRAKE